MKKVIAATMLSSVLLTLPTSTLPAGAVNGIDNTLNKGYVSVSYTAEKEGGAHNAIPDRSAGAAAKRHKDE